MRMIVYFARCYFFIKKFIGWQLLCLVSADSCEVCNNVNHKTDIGHVSVTSNLPGSPGKTGDDKKLVKSVNRGNWITLVERYQTVSHSYSKEHLWNTIHYKANYKACVCLYQTVPAQPPDSNLTARSRAR